MKFYILPGYTVWGTTSTAIVAGENPKQDVVPTQVFASFDAALAAFNRWPYVVRGYPGTEYEWFQETAEDGFEIWCGRRVTGEPAWGFKHDFRLFVVEAGDEVEALGILNERW